VTIVCVGNRWRSDDGVGLAVAARLRERGLEPVEREGEPVGILDALEGASAAVVVDAVSSGADPGTVHVLDASRHPLPASLFAHSTHHLGLGEALELARALGRLPERTLVVGIEGASWDAGDGLSPAVAAAVERAVEEVERCTSGR